MKKRFLKYIVLFCIAFITLFTIVSTYLNYRVGIELSPTLTTCVYAFFGTEILSTAFIRVLDKQDREEASGDPRQEDTQKTFYTNK